MTQPRTAFVRRASRFERSNRILQRPFLSKKTAAVFLSSLACAVGASAGNAADFPPEITSLRQGGGLCMDIQTDTGRVMHLELPTFFISDTLGNRLTMEQISRLDLLRVEAPAKFDLLQHLYPQQFAEYFLRTKMRAVPMSAAAVSTEMPVNIEIVPSGNFQAPAPMQHSPLVAKNFQRLTTPRDPDFGSLKKTVIFLSLQKEYSPLRNVGMSVIGDTLRVDGKVITENLSADAAAAGKSPEVYADECYDHACATIARVRSGQVTDRACALTMLAFLRDPRLTAFTSEEREKAFKRIFGRDLRSVSEEAEHAAEMLDADSANFLRLSQTR